MRQKLWTIISVVIIFSLAIISMNFVYYYKLLEEPEFIRSINQVEQQVEQSQWQSARGSLTAAQEDWETLLPWIQLSSEKDKLEAIESDLARLAAAIRSEKTDSARETLYAINHNWDQITN
jgi:hypothetical protein